MILPAFRPSVGNRATSGTDCRSPFEFSQNRFANSLHVRAVDFRRRRGDDLDVILAVYEEYRVRRFVREVRHLDVLRVLAPLDAVDRERVARAAHVVDEDFHPRSRIVQVREPLALKLDHPGGKVQLGAPVDFIRQRVRAILFGRGQRRKIFGQEVGHERSRRGGGWLVGSFGRFGRRVCRESRVELELLVKNPTADPHEPDEDEKPHQPFASRGWVFGLGHRSPLLLPASIRLFTRGNNIGSGATLLFERSLTTSSNNSSRNRRRRLQGK